MPNPVLTNIADYHNDDGAWRVDEDGWLKIELEEGNHVKINMNDSEVKAFFEETVSQIEKIKYKDSGRKFRNWENNTQEIITDNLQKYFGQYGEDLNPNQIIVYEESLEQANNQSTSPNSQNITNAQVFDCNPMACLTAMCLSEGCSNDNHDFYVLSKANRFSGIENKEFIEQGTSVRTVNINGQDKPVYYNHSAVVSVVNKDGEISSSNIIDSTIPAVLRNGNQQNEIMGSYNVYNYEVDGKRMPVILTFDNIRDLYNGVDKSGLFAQRVLQYRADFIKDLGIFDSETQNIIEGYANNDPNYINMENNALIMMMYKAAAYAKSEGVIDKSEFEEFISFPNHYTQNITDNFPDEFAAAKQVFANMDIVFTDMEPVQNGSSFIEQKDFITLELKLGEEAKRYKIKAEVDDNVPEGRY